MNSRNSRYTFASATPDDAGEILEILEEMEFDGKISLTFTRRPDPYASFKREGKEVEILVSRDTKENRITSVAATSINPMFVDGEPMDIGYLFGLRVRKEYRRRYLLLPKGFAYLFALHENKQIPLYITTILEENKTARRLLEKKRNNMPVYDYYGDYETYALTTGKRAGRAKEFLFRRAERNDVGALVGFLRNQGRLYQFFPALENEDLEDPEGSLSFSDFYMLCSPAGEILAAGAVWDQRRYKQYVLRGYGGIYKALYPVSFLFPFFGYPVLAKPGSILNFFTLSFWCVRDNHPEYFDPFLRHVSEVSKSYAYFVLGVDRRHPLRDTLRKKPHLLYRSRMYLVYEHDKARRAGNIDRSRIPYLEIGRL